MSDSGLNDEAGIDFDHRELCSDDTCTGILDDGGTCKECGAVDHPRAKRATGGVDLAHRSLCPDDTCIGILGPDGRCNECGQVGDAIISDPRLRGLNVSEDKYDDEEEYDDDNEDEDEDEDEDEEYDDEDEEYDDEEEEEDGAEKDLDLASRVLCSDGSCVGIIGSGGLCKECGLRPEA